VHFFCPYDAFLGFTAAKIKDSRRRIVSKNAERKDKIAEIPPGPPEVISE
jgi:hypothetical protein